MASTELRFRLILKNHQILEGSSCGYYNKTLVCFLKNISFMDAFRYFSSPEAFETVTFEIEDDYRIDRDIYSGFEQITSVTQQEETVNVSITGTDIQKTSEHIDKEREQENGTVYNPNQNQS